jgi:hypothetical protein
VIAFQTAVALAVEEADSDDVTPVLRESHIAKVVTIAKAFKDYMNSVRGNTNGKFNEFAFDLWSSTN